MGYTHGTVHTVASSDIIALASPAGLAIALADIPPGSGGYFGQPPEFFRVARVALGTADGFLPDLELRHEQNVLLPIPSGIVQLGLSLAPGVVATVTELIGSAVTFWSQNFEVVAAAAIGNTTAWTYTVPDGFELHIDGAIASMSVESVWTAQGNVSAILRLKSGTIQLYVHGVSNVIGTVFQQSLGGGPILPAGTILVATYGIGSATQVVAVHLAAWGRLVPL